MYHNADSRQAHDSGIDAAWPLARATVVLACVLSVLVLTLSGSLYAQNPSPTPPMGWSEWDSYGLSITETDFRANAAVLASLRQYGWQYAMLDAGWYIAHLGVASRNGF